MAKKGGARPRAKLTYDRNIYNPQGLTSLSDKELRKEYSRLRAIGNKRVKRLANSDWTHTDTYKYNQEGFQTLSQLTNNSEIRHELTRLARFVSSATSSIRGLQKQQKQTIETLQDNGYEFVNKSNIRQFLDFMEHARTSNGNRKYDSYGSATFFKQATEQGAKSQKELQDAYKSWKRHQNKLAKVQNKNRRDSNQYRQAYE